MKTKNDAPHMEASRYDYALLHSTYKLEHTTRATIETAVILTGLLAGLAAWVLWGLSCLG